jgi:hypothetical protein
MEESRSEQEPEAQEQTDGDRFPGGRTNQDEAGVDAMGQDKRRQVVGQQYGATVRKQLTVYGIFLAVVVGIVIAFLTVVSGIDNREMPLEDTAPWTAADAELEAPRDIDFPRNGPQDTIPEEEIGQAVPPDVSDAESGG